MNDKRQKRVLEVIVDMLSRLSAMLEDSQTKAMAYHRDLIPTFNPETATDEEKDEFIESLARLHRQIAAYNQSLGKLAVFGLIQEKGWEWVLRHPQSVGTVLIQIHAPREPEEEDEELDG